MLNINYYNKEIKDEFDNETIGIILCTGKRGVTMEYALGGLSNNIFASTYTYYIPTKDELINAFKPEQLREHLHPVIDESSVKNLEKVVGGISGAPGAAVGRV